jgi:hypothetical protein
MAVTGAMWVTFDPFAGWCQGGADATIAVAASG